MGLVFPEVILLFPQHIYNHDFALFSDDWEFLREARLAIEEYLAKFRLQIHPIKSQLFSTKIGASFLGFRIFPDRIRVRNSNLHLARRRLKRLQTDYAQGKIGREKVNQSIQSWFAHLEHGGSEGLYKSRTVAQLYKQIAGDKQSGLTRGSVSPKLLKIIIVATLLNQIWER